MGNYNVEDFKGDLDDLPGQFISDLEDLPDDIKGVFKGNTATGDYLCFKWANGVEVSLDLSLDITLLWAFEVIAFNINLRYGATAVLSKTDRGRVSPAESKLQAKTVAFVKFYEQNIDDFSRSIIDLLEVTTETKMEAIGDYTKQYNTFLGTFETKKEKSKSCIKTGDDTWEIVATNSKQEKKEYITNIKKAIFSADSWKEINKKKKETFANLLTVKTKKASVAVKKKSTENIKALIEKIGTAILSGKQIFLG